LPELANPPTYGISLARGNMRGCPKSDPSASNALPHSPRFAYYLDENPLAPPAVEFSVEDLLPRAEIEFLFPDGHYDFVAHDLPIHVGVGVVLAGAVMAVLRGRGVGCQFSSQAS
jgi:hypothetical protein